MAINNLVDFFKTDKYENGTLEKLLGSLWGSHFKHPYGTKRVWVPTYDLMSRIFPNRLDAYLTMCIDLGDSTPGLSWNERQTSNSGIFYEYEIDRKWFNSAGTNNHGVRLAFRDTSGNDVYQDYSFGVYSVILPLLDEQWKSQACFNFNDEGADPFLKDAVNDFDWWHRYDPSGKGNEMAYALYNKYKNWPLPAVGDTSIEAKTRWVYIFFHISGYMTANYSEALKSAPGSLSFVRIPVNKK